jgi:hypothetical protein
LELSAQYGTKPLPSSHEYDDANDISAEVALAGQGRADLLVITKEASRDIDLLAGPSIDTMGSIIDSGQILTALTPSLHEFKKLHNSMRKT